jgi:hypothetical protein
MHNPLDDRGRPGGAHCQCDDAETTYSSVGGRTNGRRLHIAGCIVLQGGAKMMSVGCITKME